ncbi:hypothetical protein Tco_1023740 [Tanacetum coccineum]
MEITWMQRYGSGAIRRMLSSSSSINSRKYACSLRRPKKDLKARYHVAIHLYAQSAIFSWLFPDFRVYHSFEVEYSPEFVLISAAEASTRKPQNISYNGSHFGEDVAHREMLYTPSSCPFLRAILENGTSQRQNHIESVNVQSFLLLSVYIGRIENYRSGLRKKYRLSLKNDMPPRDK